jgi:hypothetical protein
MSQCTPYIAVDTERKLREHIVVETWETFILNVSVFIIIVGYSYGTFYMQHM